MIGSNVIIDLSHHNGQVDLQKAADSCIVAVIQKATEGTAYRDPTFALNRQKAAAAGLLFGAYHFGAGADGVAQAEFFLNVVQPQPGDLLVLDFETNTQGPSMTMEQARAFVTHVQRVNGRFPGLYSGSYLKELLGSATDPVLTNCWLWLSQYGPKAVIPPAWKAWTMWQYTNGAVGPEPVAVPGVGACDRDTFNGTVDDLKAFWRPATATAP